MKASKSLEGFKYFLANWMGWQYFAVGNQFNAKLVTDMQQSKDPLVLKIVMCSPVVQWCYCNVEEYGKMIWM